MSEVISEVSVVVVSEAAVDAAELLTVADGVGISEEFADAAVFEQSLTGEATPETAVALGQAACVTCVGCPFFQQCGKAQAEQVRAEMAADGDETTQLVELIERPVASYLSELLSDDGGLVMARTERVVLVPGDVVVSSPKPAAIPHRTDPEMPKTTGGDTVERGEIMSVVDVGAGEMVQPVQPMDDQEYSAAIEELPMEQVAAACEMSPVEADTNGEVESAEVTKRATVVNDGEIPEMPDTNIVEEGETSDGNDRPVADKIVEAAAEDGDMAVTMQLVDDSIGQIMRDAVVSATVAEDAVSRELAPTGVLEMASAPGELAVSGRYKTSVDMLPQEASEELIIPVASIADRQATAVEAMPPEMEDELDSVADEPRLPEEDWRGIVAMSPEREQSINEPMVTHDGVVVRDSPRLVSLKNVEQLADTVEHGMVPVECDETIWQGDGMILPVSGKDDGQPSRGRSVQLMSAIDMAADDERDACGNLVDNQPEVEDQTADDTGVLSAWAADLLGVVAVTLALTRQWAVARTGILKESKGV